MTDLKFLSVVFADWQIALMIVLGVVLVLAVVGNVVLFNFLRKSRKRQLCTRQLQERREECLKRLADLREGGLFDTDDDDTSDDDVAAVDEAEPEDDMDDTDDDADDVQDVPVPPVLAPESEPNPAYRVLAVKDMSQSMRTKFELTDEKFDNKRYYVRYAYGFEAKLRVASEEVQQRYKAIVDEASLYKGVKIRYSFKQHRITKGNKTLAILLFRGKTLCIALALEPNVYAESKYRGIDMSDKKRFKNTPLMLKLTSERKTVYAKYLFMQVADDNTIVLSDRPEVIEYDFSQKTDAELFDMNRLRIRIMGEAPDAPDGETDGEGPAGE